MDVTFERVSRAFGKVQALQEVTLSISGGLFGLLGPNGAGKTTLMRILTTLLAPTAGRVRVAGADVTADPGWVRQRLGYLPQEFGFYRGLTGREMLEYIAILKNIPPQRRRAEVDRALEAVHLEQDARRKVGAYSGGMRQRLGIAQALLGEPGLIVVDEPTAGLDPEERIRFRNLLARLAAERTVILSTHIVGDIEASCAGLAVLNQGRVVFTGAPGVLAAQAAGRVWQTAVPIERWPDFEARHIVLGSRGSNAHMDARVFTSERPEGAQPAEPTLEDGYIALIRGAAQARSVGEVRHG